MRYKIFFLFFVIATNQLSAQKADEFVITVDIKLDIVEQNVNFIDICKTPDLGVIVFTSSIKGISFKIQNDPSLLENPTYYDKENNRYILCVKPNKKYQILISCQGFKDENYIVSDMSASEKKWFVIDSKDKSLIEKLKKTNQENKSIEKEVKYEKFQNKKLERKYNYISVGFGSGISETFSGEFTVGWRSEGKIGWGIHGGIMPNKKKNYYQEDYTHYSVGLKCYPLQGSDFAKDLMKPITMQDLYLLISYGTVSKYPEVTNGMSIIVGLDWLIPFFKNPDGGIIIRGGMGAAFPNFNKSSLIAEGGISLYINL